MELISQTAVEGIPGPTYPEAYRRIDGLTFHDGKFFTQGQPFDTFAKLRMAAPVCWHPEPEGWPGFWVVTRHADVMRVNGDPATFSSQRGGILMNTPKPGMGHMLLGRASQDTMINLDAPHHMQLRREHMPFFTPAYLRGLTDRVKAEVTRLIDNMQGKGECDLVENFRRSCRSTPCAKSLVCRRRIARNSCTGCTIWRWRRIWRRSRPRRR